MDELLEVLERWFPRSRSVRTGEVTVGTTIVRMPQMYGTIVYIKAQVTNAGNVYVGRASVAVRGGTTADGVGFELEPGALTPPIPIEDLEDLYLISDTASQEITYLVYGG
ncbi:MAG: hypothetical protein GY767_14000 [Shimia sp.]|nr:hypothetical protein [Shimia sp.]